MLDFRVIMWPEKGRDEALPCLYIEMKSDKA